MALWISRLGHFSVTITGFLFVVMKIYIFGIIILKYIELAVDLCLVWKSKCTCYLYFSLIGWKPSEEGDAFNLPWLTYGQRHMGLHLGGENGQAARKSCISENCYIREMLGSFWGESKHLGVEFIQTHRQLYHSGILIFCCPSYRPSNTSAIFSQIQLDYPLSIYRCKRSNHIPSHQSFSSKV